jgi:hypothetical protein
VEPPAENSGASPFSAAADANALRMENELLAFEVRFLRARLGLPGISLTGTASTASASRIARLEDAERHLKMVMERLSATPLRPVFRLHPSFKALERRYVRPGREKAPQGSATRLAQLEEAERDLTALVRRLSGSPAARILRRRREFRLLEQRYLSSPTR